jgi:hypothetical protein
MLRSVALVRSDVSQEISGSIIRLAIIGELGTLAVTSNRREEMPLPSISAKRASVASYD